MKCQMCEKTNEYVTMDNDVFNQQYSCPKCKHTIKWSTDKK